MLAVYLENGVVGLRDAPVPERPKAFALLRLLMAGICKSGRIKKMPSARAAMVPSFMKVLR